MNDLYSEGIHWAKDSEGNIYQVELKYRNIPKGIIMVVKTISSKYKDKLVIRLIPQEDITFLLGDNVVYIFDKNKKRYVLREKSYMDNLTYDDYRNGNDLIKGNCSHYAAICNSDSGAKEHASTLNFILPFIKKRQEVV